ncbi:MAG: hypothetical protein G01um101448_120 [Parcubacteria group bacterium Gr01-1014_48]|nr:MAG: hypothetical protein Greene041614_42 [Parcubacteria group bacterium Greene0416_14]TSC74479.1 MAG: hypothetical protein G01um101448_120 [Parcubacteria group bacterium Gr01-1014_48]TSD01790.1 MAG: hypothetical protein Greene101415_48 [Parcubacteria group bacterium Greene1014_15]TSD08504.1 MAG: hypothetical protein Greene07144_43 [Parcubacteria group bacterium Greene0714_4]
MKTILITSFHNFTARNILVAPFLKLLTEAGDIRVVVVVPEGKVPFYETSFGGKNVIVHGVPGRLRHIDAFLKDLAFASMRTKSLGIMRSHNIGIERLWSQKLLFWAPIIQRFIPFLYAYLVPRRTYADVFELYAPSLLLASDVFSATDNRLMHEARFRNIPIIGIVRSWDNLTTKGPLRVRPNILVVQNEMMKKEAVDLHGMREEDVRPIGIPHHDRYVNGPKHSWSEFIASIGGDSSKKIILYAAQGDRHFKNTTNTFDQNMINSLAEMIPATHELLVRLPIADTVYLGGLRHARKVLFDQPGMVFDSDMKKIKKNELCIEDDDHLIDTLYYSSVVISVSTSLFCDATLCDRPTITVGFGGLEWTLQFNHLQPLLRSGGIYIARTPMELKFGIERYIHDVSQDRTGRQKIRDTLVSGYDGHASERLYALVCSFLRANTL